MVMGAFPVQLRRFDEARKATAEKKKFGGRIEEVS